MNAIDLGKPKRGIWRLSRRELCLDFMQRGKPASDCYDIWLSANKVRFQRDGVLIIEGMLLDE